MIHTTVSVATLILKQLPGTGNLIVFPFLLMCPQLHMASIPISASFGLVAVHQCPSEAYQSQLVVCILNSTNVLPDGVDNPTGYPTGRSPVCRGGGPTQTATDGMLFDTKLSKQLDDFSISLAIKARVIFVGAGQTALSTVHGGEMECCIGASFDQSPDDPFVAMGDSSVQRAFLCCVSAEPATMPNHLLQRCLHDTCIAVGELT